ncbi:MAG: hypothetical protein KC417_05450 [Myxococcales bacterium]|nr:hypothetical protein [Myxococcales bacterium]
MNELAGGPPPTSNAPPPPSPFDAGAFLRARDGGYVPSDDEHQAALYAHLFAAGASFLTLGIGLAVLAPYLAVVITKQKGPFLLFHVNQAAIYQGAVSIVSLSLGLTGMMCCAPIFLLPVSWLILGAGYPIYVGLRAQDGLWEEYLFVGAKVLRDWRPFFT